MDPRVEMYTAAFGQGGNGIDFPVYLGCSQFGQGFDYSVYRGRGQHGQGLVIYFVVFGDSFVQ